MLLQAKLDLRNCDLGNLINILQEPKINLIKSKLGTGNKI